MKALIWPALAVLALAFAVNPAPAKTITVTIDRLAFAPVSLEAKVGDTIEWVNKDVLAHTATVTGGWEVMISPKSTGRITLKDAGVVDYFCRFHPNMKGRLEVAP